MNHKTQIPHDGPRVETGTLQLGDDWPGVFIRGDNALMHYVPMLEHLRSRLVIPVDAESIEDMLLPVMLDELILLFKSCDYRLHP